MGSKQVVLIPPRAKMENILESREVPDDVFRVIIHNVVGAEKGSNLFDNPVSVNTERLLRILGLNALLASSCVVRRLWKPKGPFVLYISNDDMRPGPLLEFLNLYHVLVESFTLVDVDISHEDLAAVLSKLGNLKRLTIGHIYIEEDSRRGNKWNRADLRTTREFCKVIERNGKTLEAVSFLETLHVDYDTVFDTVARYCTDNIKSITFCQVVPDLRIAWRTGMIEACFYEILMKLSSQIGQVKPTFGSAQTFKMRVNSMEIEDEDYDGDFDRTPEVASESDGESGDCVHIKLRNLVHDVCHDTTWGSSKCEWFSEV